MSHFLAYVLIDATTKADDVESVVAEALAKYDENIEVPEHGVRCYCVGSAAKMAARIAADEAVGTIKSIRAAYHTDPEMSAALNRQHDLRCLTAKLTTDQVAEFRALDAITDSKWKEAIAPYVAAESKALAEHPFLEVADPECDDCNGTGTRQTTRNPLSKWDWWVVGGRWAGSILGRDDDMPEDLSPFTVGRDLAEKSRRVRNDVRNNSRRVPDFPLPIPDEQIPFAIVTPDGEWHEKGSMGWFGCVSGAKDDWKDVARSILAAHPGSLAVAVDLHI